MTPLEILAMKTLLLLFTVALPLCITAQANSFDTNSPNATLQNVKYRCIGPFRGGRSVSSCGVIGDPLTYYMGTTGGGLWKTTDAGQHWNNISDGYFATGSVGAVAVSDSDPNVVFVGMGEHAPRGVQTSHGDGVYKSTDAGKSWVHMGLKPTQHISRIIIHPKNPDLVYVAAQGALYGPTKERGIYKSTDGGESWENVLFINDNTGCAELSMDIHNPRVLYAAMWHHQRFPWKVMSGGEGSGLYKSTDGGDTWRALHEGLPKELGKMAIAVCRSNPDRVYALIESDSDKDQGGLFVSTNAGKNWSRVSDDNRLTQRAWYYTEVFPDPVDEHTVYVLSAPALRSIDGGKSWERVTGTHGDFHDLWINPNNPKNLCISNDGGAAISFDRGKNWSTQYNMPTAQIYRVNADNHFPYRIYGGQQDNTSIRIESRELGGGGIYEENWDPSAGGESAFLAFDPDDPRYVLGGSYLGTIEVLDTEADAGTNIMAAPIQYLGRAARDMRYRYNWNAPVIWSQHEPNTYYHAAQILLRTRDMGQTWEEVSPDLSKDEDHRQGLGGGPYTNEAVGAENYGTISFVAESPHEAGVIWVTTDDGNVQLTRDNCQSWQNVTPKGLPDCLVNSIDVSPHDAATAYIATTRYKFNDHTPALYKTSNYGRTWTNISSGIPHGAFTRVVREDTGRKGLLFAGTETGVYTSWDDGQSWHSLQLNLPVTPITDLIIRHDDLIIATSGRSFWILDDLELVRQWDQATSGVQLFEPASAYLVNGYSELNGNSEEFKGTAPLHGINPANGVVVYFKLPEVTDSADVKLEIRDAQGTLVRQLSSVKDADYQKYDGGPPAETTVPAKSGLNRVVWDMRYPVMAGVPGVYIEGSYRGRKVAPGTYTIELKVNGQSVTANCVILPNPRYALTAEDYARYDEVMREMEGKFNEMHTLTNSVYEIRQQIEAMLDDLPDEAAYSAIRTSGESMVAEMKKWDEEMVQRKSKAYDDVENFPNKFTAEWMFMMNHAESDIPRINQGTMARLEELGAQWVELRAQADILMDEVPPFNRLLWEAGVGAIKAIKRVKP